MSVRPYIEIVEGPDSGQEAHDLIYRTPELSRHLVDGMWVQRDVDDAIAEVTLTVLGEPEFDALESMFDELATLTSWHLKLCWDGIKAYIDDFDRPERERFKPSS